ncbi:hypothetical protein SDC9_187111 [bioreactor metagenome]|uniref:Uncharacterized protein n=1 Tax=bioreactor metagenome TaxID=1076179 RepID=A0A645HW61_9ZZZZ
MLVNLASFNLIQLCGYDDRIVPLCHDPVVHHLVIGRRIMADINQQEYRF